MASLVDLWNLSVIGDQGNSRQQSKAHFQMSINFEFPIT